MRLLICAGGTGGGVYPALAVHSALTSQQPKSEILWVGGEGGMEEELVKRAGIPYRSIPAAGVHGVGLRALPGNVAKLTRGVLASRRILREFKPDVLFFTGGFVAAPMAVAGMKVPTALYVPDIEPGLALKFLSRFADVITVTADASKRFFQRSSESSSAATRFAPTSRTGPAKKPFPTLGWMLRDCPPCSSPAEAKARARSIWR